MPARPGRAWLRWLPGVGVARSYQPSWLRGDAVAGIVLTALLVPQGMAYAELAGLPPVTGLYTTVVALLAYALFGPSRILILGPDSSLGPLIAATIIPLVGAGGDPATAIALAGMLAILMGAACLLAGLAHLGGLTELLSKPVRVGYLNGIAIIVVVSQLPKLFGFSIDADGFWPELRAWGRGVAEGETDPTALVDRSGLHRRHPRLPALAAGHPRRPRGRDRGHLDRGGLRPRRAGGRADPHRLPLSPSPARERRAISAGWRWPPSAWRS